MTLWLCRVPFHGGSLVGEGSSFDGLLVVGLACEEFLLVFVGPSPSGVCGSEDVCCCVGLGDLFLLVLTLVFLFCFGFFFFPPLTPEPCQ